MLKVKSPMATSILRVGCTAGLSLVDEYLAAANAALERLAHAITNKDYSPASPLQTRVRWRSWLFGVRFQSITVVFRTVHRRQVVRVSVALLPVIIEVNVDHATVRKVLAPHTEQD